MKGTREGSDPSTGKSQSRKTSRRSSGTDEPDQNQKSESFFSSFFRIPWHRWMQGSNSPPEKDEEEAEERSRGRGKPNPELTLNSGTSSVRGLPPSPSSLLLSDSASASASSLNSASVLFPVTPSPSSSESSSKTPPEKGKNDPTSQQMAPLPFDQRCERAYLCNAPVERPIPLRRRRFLILSLDGGGVRISLTAVLLGRLFSAFPNLEERVDLFAGSSAGAILACGTALRSFAACSNLVGQASLSSIFSSSSMVRSLDRGMYEAEYDSAALVSALSAYFGPHTRVCDSVRKVFITSFFLGNSSNSDAHGHGGDQKRVLEPANRICTANDDNNNADKNVCDGAAGDGSGGSNFSRAECCSAATTDNRQCFPPSIRRRKAQVDILAPRRTANSFSAPTDSTFSASSAASSGRRDWGMRLIHNLDRTKLENAGLSQAGIWTRPENYSLGNSRDNSRDNSRGGSNSSNLSGKEKFQTEQDENNNDDNNKNNNNNNNNNNENVDGECTTLFVDALVSSSAAPTYFPAHNRCVDGGMLSNCPALLAASTAVRFGLCDFSDIDIISIGTGYYPVSFDAYGSEADLGDIQWASRIVDLLFDAAEQSTVYVGEHLFGAGRFVRIQPTLDANYRLDDVSALPRLRQVGQEFDLGSAYSAIDDMLRGNY